MRGIMKRKLIVPTPPTGAAKRRNVTPFAANAAVPPVTRNELAVVAVAAAIKDSQETENDNDVQPQPPPPITEEQQQPAAALLVLPPSLATQVLASRRRRQLTASAPTPSTLMTATNANKRVTAAERLDAFAATPAPPSSSTPQRALAAMAGGGATASVQSLSAAERATMRASQDEKRFFNESYQQAQKWIALARLGQNYIATAVTAATAVDMARAEEPGVPRAPT